MWEQYGRGFYQKIPSATALEQRSADCIWRAKGGHSLYL